MDCDEIFYAIRTSNLQSSHLINADIDINARNNKGITMLSYAAAWNNLKSIEFLVRKGADSNVTNSDGSKPLHIAAIFGHVPAVKFFLNEGMFVDSCDKNNCTPLHYVSSRRDISPDVAFRYQELVHFLVARKANLNSVNQDGRTPLLFAARNKRRDIVDLLVKLGANVDGCDNEQWTLLHYSSRYQWLDMVRFLVKKGSAVDLNAKTSKGETPLIIAAQYSSSYNKDVVDFLIESGANVECRCTDDWTLLHYACLIGWLDVVQYIVNKGSDINAETSNGNTPLLAARNSRSISLYLIESGANVQCPDRNYWTALHIACDYRRLDVVKSLIKKGSDLNAQDCDNNTPLHAIVVRDRSKPNAWDDLEIIQHLLETGADHNIKNYNGDTSFRCFIQKIIYLKEGMYSEDDNFQANDDSENWNISEEGIRIFLKYGAYFEIDDYVAISEIPLLKNSILKDEILCTQDIINKFNNGDLPKIYEIPAVASRLPSYEKMKIASNKEVARDIAKCVKHEIQTKGFCNVLNVPYIALSVLCVKSLFESYSS